MKLSRTSVGLAVRAAREAAKLTLTDLSGETNISVAALSRSENGLRDIEFAEAVSIAAATHIDVETLRTLAATFEREGAPAIARKKGRLDRDLNELQRVAIEAAIEVRAIGIPDAQRVGVVA
jgi:transcriptional regulator with XRE-family HTH domain